MEVLFDNCTFDITIGPVAYHITLSTFNRTTFATGKDDTFQALDMQGSTQPVFEYGKSFLKSSTGAITCNGI